MGAIEKIQKRYNRNAKFYDFMESMMEKGKMGEWRKNLWKEAQGKVLEVGVGTGQNIIYYPENSDITAIDFSERMLEKAKEKADKSGRKVDFRLMNVQKLDFPDNTFDTVVTTCVFCSVPDPVKGLMEIKRVCKDNGKIIMLEHVKSQKRVLGHLMDLFNPLSVVIAGANINRDTIGNLKKAGLTVRVENNLMMDIVKYIACSK